MAWKAWLHNDRMSTSLGTPMVIPYLLLPNRFCPPGPAVRGRAGSDQEEIFSAPGEARRCGTADLSLSFLKAGIQNILF